MAPTWQSWSWCSGVRRIALALEYNGAAYHGSQLQANGRSIQAEVEAALHRLTGESPRVALAGRTDAGVHALGQVAAFTTATRHEPPVIMRALNALLPADIAVRAAVEAPDDFDPRRHARCRLYRYTIWNTASRSPLRRGTTWHVRAPLDERAMSAEAALLVGEHDVASFGGPLPPGRSSIRRVERVDVRRDGEVVTLEIAANAFLPHQVRRTAGALVEIGSGKLHPGAFGTWLATPCTGSAGPAAPPWGLCLVEVTYDNLDLSPISPARAEVGVTREAMRATPVPGAGTGRRGFNRNAPVPIREGGREIGS